MFYSNDPFLAGLNLRAFLCSRLCYLVTRNCAHVPICFQAAFCGPGPTSRLEYEAPLPTSLQHLLAAGLRFSSLTLSTPPARQAPPKSAAAKGSLAAAAAGNRLGAATAADTTAAGAAGMAAGEAGDEQRGSGHERGADLESVMAAAQAAGCSLSPSLLTLDPGAAWERGAGTDPRATHQITSCVYITTCQLDKLCSTSIPSVN